MPGFRSACHIYCIAENFCRLLAGAAKRRYVHTPVFHRENFRKYPQNLETCEIFLPQSFPLHISTHVLLHYVQNISIRFANQISRTTSCCDLTIFEPANSLESSHAQTPPSHETSGLVSTECFLGCADSAVSVLNKPMK